MEKICGTCSSWKPEVRNRIGNGMTYRNEDPLCTMIKIKGKFKIKYAEDKPESWCWKRASTEQLASRVKARLIKL